jgi:hypothetical protein
MTDATATLQDVKAYVRKQTMVSVFLSMLFSGLMFALAFRNASLNLWAPDYLGIDFLPQASGTLLMAALIPSLQARTAVLRGKLPGQPIAVRRIVLRALGFASLGLILGALAIAVLQATGISVFSWTSALAIKLTFGGILGLVATPLAVRAVLTEG